MKNVQSAYIPSNQRKGFRFISCLTLWVYILNFVISPVYASAVDAVAPAPKYAHSFPENHHTVCPAPVAWETDADIEVQLATFNYEHKQEFLLSLRVHNQDLGDFVFDPAQSSSNSLFQNVYDNDGELCAWKCIYGDKSPGLLIATDGTVFLSHSNERTFTGVYRLRSALPVLLTGACKFQHLQVQSPYVSVNEGSIIEIEKCELKGTTSLCDLVVNKNASLSLGGFDFHGNLLNFGICKFYAPSLGISIKGSSIQNYGIIESLADLSLANLRLLQNFGDINIKGLLHLSTYNLLNHKNIKFENAYVVVKGDFLNASDAAFTASQELELVSLGKSLNEGTVSAKKIKFAANEMEGKGTFTSDEMRVTTENWDGAGNFTGQSVDFSYSKLKGDKGSAKFSGCNSLRFSSLGAGALNLASVRGGQVFLNFADTTLNVDELSYVESLELDAKDLVMKSASGKGNSKWKVRNVLACLQDKVELLGDNNIAAGTLQFNKLVAFGLTSRAQTLKGKVIHTENGDLSFDSIADECSVYEFVAKKKLQLRRHNTSQAFTNTGHLQAETLSLQNSLENKGSIVAVSAMHVNGNITNTPEAILETPLLVLEGSDQPLINQGQLGLERLEGVKNIENQGFLTIDQQGLALDSLENSGTVDLKSSAITVQKFVNHESGMVLPGKRTQIADYTNHGSVVIQDKNLRLHAKQGLGQVIADNGSVVWDVLPETYKTVIDVEIQASPDEINHSLDIAAKASNLDDYLTKADKSKPFATLLGFLTFASTPGQPLFENIGSSKVKARWEAILNRLGLSNDPFALIELLDQAANGIYRSHLADAVGVDNALLEFLSGAWLLNYRNLAQMNATEDTCRRLGKSFYQQKLDLKTVEQKVFKALAKYREANKDADQALLKTHFENIFKYVTEGFLKAQADDRETAELIIQSSAAVQPLTVDLEALIRNSPIYADHVQVNYADNVTTQGELVLPSPFVFKARKFCNKGTIVGGLTLVVDEFTNGVDNNHMGGIAAEDDSIFVYSLGKVDNRFGRIFSKGDSAVEALGGAVLIGAVKEVTTPQRSGCNLVSSTYQKMILNGAFVSCDSGLRVISYFDDLYNDYGEVFSSGTSVLRGNLIRNLSGVMRSQASIYMYGTKYYATKPNQQWYSSHSGGIYTGCGYYLECADPASIEAMEDIHFNLPSVDIEYSNVSSNDSVYKLGELIASPEKEYKGGFNLVARFEHSQCTGNAGTKYQYTHTYANTPSSRGATIPAIVRAGDNITVQGPDKVTITGSMSAGLNLTIDVESILTRCLGIRRTGAVQNLSIDLYEVAKKATGGFFALEETGRVDTVYPITSRFSYEDMPLTTIDGQKAGNVAVSETAFEFALQRALAEQAGTLRMDGHSGAALREYLFRNSMAQGSALSLEELANTTVKPLIAMVAREVMGTLQSIPHLLVPAQCVNPYQASGDVYANQMKLLTCGNQVHEGSRVIAKEKLEAIAKGKMQRTSTKYVELDIQKKSTTRTEHLAAQQEMGCEQGDATIIGKQGYEEMGVQSHAAERLVRGATHGNTDIRALVLTTNTESRDKKSGGIFGASKTTLSSASSTRFVATEGSAGATSTIIGVNITETGARESARNLLEYQAQESINHDAAVGANSNASVTTTKGVSSKTKVSNSSSVPVFLSNELRAHTIRFKAKSANVRGSALQADTVEDKTVDGAVFGPTLGIMRYEQSVRSKQPLRSSSAGARGGREVMMPTTIQARRIVRCPSLDRLTENERQRAEQASMRFISVQKTNAEIIGRYEEIEHSLRSWNETWSRQSQVLPNGAIQVLAVAVTIASKGMASGIFSTSLSGTMASAGFRCLVSMAASNFATTGDIGATARSLVSAQGVRTLAISMASAGILKELSESLKIPLSTKSLELTDHLKTEGLKALVNTSLNVTYDAAAGIDPLQSLSQGAKGFASGVVASYGASHIGDWYKGSDHTSGDYAIHKVLHFMNGGLAGHILTGDKKGFVSGGMGAAVSEMILEAREQYLTEKALERLNEACKNGEPLTPEKLEEINRLNQRDLETEIDRAQLGTSIVAALLNQDVNIATTVGLTAAEHNFEPTIGGIVGGALLAWGVYEVIDIYRTQGLDKAMEHLVVMGVVTVATAGAGAVVYKIGAKAYPSAQLAWNALLTNYPKYGELIGKITGSKAATTLAKVKDACDGVNLALARASQKIGLSKAGVSVEIPHGLALQSSTTEALAAMQRVKQGATLYRIGTMGRSHVKEAQFWSLEHPATTKGFIQQFGIPSKNVASPNFIVTGTMKPGAKFVTREAPGVGNNMGGGIEVVVQPGDVTLKSFSVIE